MILLGVKIPDNKRTEISLTYVYGIGRSSAQKILSAAKIDLSKRVKDLTPEEVKKIKEFVCFPKEIPQSIKDKIDRP